MTATPAPRSTPRKRRSTAAAATGADPESLRAQGLRTRNAIIKVARKLLLEGGSLEFSLRAVAMGAGISISNLQYYFPTRMAVVRAVIQPIMDVYLENLQRGLGSDATPREMLERLMQQTVEDAKNSKDVALWWHFVSLASSDAECAKLLQDWYDTLTRGIAQLVRAVNPALKPAECTQVAVLLAAMADGLAMQVSTAGRESTRALEARYLATVHQIVGLEPATA
jgi:AcrR family transcriptional regulator